MGDCTVGRHGCQRVLTGVWQRGGYRARQAKERARGRRARPRELGKGALGDGRSPEVAAVTAGRLGLMAHIRRGRVRTRERQRERENHRLIAHLRAKLVEGFSSPVTQPRRRSAAAGRRAPPGSYGGGVLGLEVAARLGLRKGGAVHKGLPFIGRQTSGRTRAGRTSGGDGARAIQQGRQSRR